MQPLTAPDRFIKSALRVTEPVVVGMNDVGIAPSSICGAAKASSVPIAELLADVVKTKGAKLRFVNVPLADIVKVSLQRKTFVPHRSTLRIRFTMLAFADTSPLLNEPLTLNPEPILPEAAPVITA
jgi:hypothetical protein